MGGSRDRHRGRRVIKRERGDGGGDGGGRGGELTDRQRDRPCTRGIAL